VSARAEPRHSATVILVRPVGEADWASPLATAVNGRLTPDDSTGTPYEVFMVRRPTTQAFAPDVYVFPGGTLRPDDWPSAQAPTMGLTATAADARLGGPDGAGLDAPEGSLALWVTALRELFEEAGVLLAHDAAGELVAFDDPAVAAHFAAHRATLARGEQSLWELAAREGLVPAPERLRYWAHWVTPEAARLRYNTRFFLALMPPRQQALHCGEATLSGAQDCTAETTDGLWIVPGDAVARHAAREFPLVFATFTHLERLATFSTLEALWAHTENKPIVTVLPSLQADVSPPRIVIPAEVRECW
jgi:8-oxo-dGTP pyrophosphatase MutT (NUDIX family)